MTTKLKRIILTGGGTAGHVTPNLAIIDKLTSQGWSCFYIGSSTGIERSLVRDIPFYSIPTGKLRRYFSWQNVIDPFKILAGIFKSILLLYRLKPSIVFSKGGFVGFPVVVAARVFNIPVIIHESDLTPGLANKLSYPFASKICLSFADTKRFFKHPNAVVTGAPLRQTVFEGSAEKGLQQAKLNNEKPTLLIVGGSLGADSLNRTVRAALPALLNKFQIIHVCGNQKVDESLTQPGYTQFEYVNEGFNDLLAAADIIVSRSGANAVYETIALKKPHIFVPLPTTISRGEQIHNAKHFANKGISTVIFQNDLNKDSLEETLESLMKNARAFQAAMEKENLQNGLDNVVGVIVSLNSK